MLGYESFQTELILYFKVMMQNQQMIENNYNSTKIFDFLPAFFNP